MKLNFLKYILGLLCFCSYAQYQDLELKINEGNESKFVKSYVNNTKSSLFVVTFETNKIKRSEQYYLYKINLKTKKIENKTTLKRDLVPINIIIKEENDSLKIINYQANNENVNSFIFSSDLKFCKSDSLPIVNYINKHKLKYFFDSNKSLIYINSKPKLNLSSRHFLDKDTLFLFENNPIDNLIRFSKISSKNNYDKKFPYSSQIGYESNFREYNKYRFNGDFLFSDNKVYVYPYLNLIFGNSLYTNPFNVLVFDKNNGDLINTQKVSFEKFIECEKLNVLIDIQLDLSLYGVGLIQFGLDNNENFCVCASKPISPNFSSIEKISINGDKIFIGKDYKNIVKIIF
jgi:hypothetical protein